VRVEVHAGFWWGNPRERDHLEEDSIKMDLTEVGWGGVYWIELAQECGIELSGSIKCGEFLN